MSRVTTVTPEALARARALGLYGDTEKRVLRAARRSAPFTSPLGNRRFQGFALTIECGVVKDIVRLPEERPCN